MCYTGVRTEFCLFPLSPSPNTEFDLIYAHELDNHLATKHSTHTNPSMPRVDQFIRKTHLVKRPISLHSPQPFLLLAPATAHRSRLAPPHSLGPCSKTGRLLSFCLHKIIYNILSEDRPSYKEKISLFSAKRTHTHTHNKSIFSQSF
jgi:hypothetical protein